MTFISFQCFKITAKILYCMGFRDTLENTQGELFWELSADFKLRVPAGIQTHEKKKKLNNKKSPNLFWPHLDVTCTTQIHVRHSDLMIIIGSSDCSLLTSNQHCCCTEGNWRGQREIWSSARTQVPPDQPTGAMAQEPHSRHRRRPWVSWLHKANPVLKELLPNKTSACSCRT